MANEKRLIDANALKDEFRRYMVDRYDNERCVSEENCIICGRVCLFQRKVNNAPTVEAEPVVHGHWVKYNFLGHEQWACSECQTLGSPQWKRCPVCEAKMDGERKDNENP